jgi:hypothetical protein
MIALTIRPFGLSLSKACLSVLTNLREGRGFDRPSPNGTRQQARAG